MQRSQGSSRLHRSLRRRQSLQDSTARRLRLRAGVSAMASETKAMDDKKETRAELGLCLGHVGAAGRDARRPAEAEEPGGPREPRECGGGLGRHGRRNAATPGRRPRRAAAPPTAVMFATGSRARAAADHKLLRSRVDPLRGHRNATRRDAPFVKPPESQRAREPESRRRARPSRAARGARLQPRRRPQTRGGAGESPSTMRVQRPGPWHNDIMARPPRPSTMQTPAVSPPSAMENLDKLTTAGVALFDLNTEYLARCDWCVVALVPRPRRLGVSASRRLGVSASRRLCSLCSH